MDIFSSNFVENASQPHMRSKITVRHGYCVAHGLTVEEAAILMSRMQVGYCDSNRSGAHGVVAQKLVDLAQSVQYEIASTFTNQRCNTLKGGIYCLRKSKRCDAGTIKKLSQLNDAASLLRHACPAWIDSLLGEVKQVLKAISHDGETTSIGIVGESLNGMVVEGSNFSEIPLVDDNGGKDLVDEELCFRTPNAMVANGDQVKKDDISQLAEFDLITIDGEDVSNETIELDDISTSCYDGNDISSADGSLKSAPCTTIISLHELLELDETPIEVSNEFRIDTIDWHVLHDLHAAAFGASAMTPIWSEHEWLFNFNSATGNPIDACASTYHSNVHVLHNVSACVRSEFSEANALEVTTIAIRITVDTSLDWAYEFILVSDCIPSRCFGVHHNEDSKARQLKAVMVQCQCELPHDGALTDVLLDSLNEFYGYSGSIQLEGWLSNSGDELCLVCDQEPDQRFDSSESE